MILRKPYALFIKLFKPIHLVLSFLAVYVIILNTKLLTVFTTYIYNENVTTLIGYKSNNLSVIFPILLIFLIFLIFLVMNMKKKATRMYKLIMLFMLVVTVINIYTNKFMTGIDKDTIVSIESVKVAHDLLFINILLSGISFVTLFSRGLGLDIKKFDFNSDILDIDISEEDREEIEVTVNVDVDEEKRKRKKKLRKLKYFVIENKFFVILGISLILLASIIIFLSIKFSPENRRKEGIAYNLSSGYIGVNRSYILKNDYKNKKINDNYFVVIDTFMYSFMEDYNFYSKDLKLEIGETLFSPTKKFRNEFSDLGTIYNDNILTKDRESYLLIYEVPKKYINSKMTLNCFGTNSNVKIHLTPKKERTKITTSYKTGEESTTNLEGIKYTINSYEVKNTFVLNYNHCINDYCIESKEYLKPKLDQNYNEAILKLNVDYINEGKYEIKNFYNLLRKYGYIEYTIDKEVYYQYSNIDEVTSNRVNLKNNLYVEVNEDLLKADSIKLIFNIQGTPYEYVLKEASYEK